MVDAEAALAKLRQQVELIDEYGRVYDVVYHGDFPDSRAEVALADLDDRIRRGMRLLREVAKALGEDELVGSLAERGESYAHHWTNSRKALVELEAALVGREEIQAIVGPVGPQLNVSSLHPTIWQAAAARWDGGHRRQAVQTAGQALEGILQGYAGPALSGEKLAVLFSTQDRAGAGSCRLRIAGIDEDSPTWRSAQEGAAALVRGAMMAVRNLVSHPGWPEPDEGEGLEMLAVLSYVAHLTERSHVDEVVD